MRRGQQEAGPIHQCNNAVQRQQLGLEIVALLEMCKQLRAQCQCGAHTAMISSTALLLLTCPPWIQVQDDADKNSQHSTAFTVTESPEFTARPLTLPSGGTSLCARGVACSPLAPAIVVDRRGICRTVRGANCIGAAAAERDRMRVVGRSIVHRLR